MTQGSSVMTSFLTLIWRIWCRCICHQKPPKVFMSLPSSSSLSSSSTAWIFSRGYFEFVTYGAAAYAIAGYWNAAGHHCDESSSQSLSSISFSSLPSFFLIVMIVNLAHLSQLHCNESYSQSLSSLSLSLIIMILYWFLLLSNLICKSRYYNWHLFSRQTEAFRAITPSSVLFH